MRRQQICPVDGRYHRCAILRSGIAIENVDIAFVADDFANTIFVKLIANFFHFFLDNRSQLLVVLQQDRRADVIGKVIDGARPIGIGQMRQRIRLQGKGNAGLNGGAPGDLFVIVRTGTNSVFSRSGDDIHLTVPVTVAEASLGAKVDVPTIDGRAQLKIPPGTQSGQKLRMRERGVESASHPGQRGDQIVTIEVVVPHLQDERSKEIMRELAKLNNQDPRVELFSKL